MIDQTKQLNTPQLPTGWKWKDVNWIRDEGDTPSMWVAYAYRRNSESLDCLSKMATHPETAMALVVEHLREEGLYQ